MPGDLFKALSDATRRDILRLLRDGDLTAGTIADNFSISKPSISHHLATLRNAGLVESERRGQEIVYSLNSTVFQELLAYSLEFLKNNDEGGSEE
jgi:ArsR family transcriptional regulator